MGEGRSGYADLQAGRFCVRKQQYYTNVLFPAKLLACSRSCGWPLSTDGHVVRVYGALMELFSDMVLTWEGGCRLFVLKEHFKMKPDGCPCSLKKLQTIHHWLQVSVFKTSTLLIAVLTDNSSCLKSSTGVFYIFIIMTSASM